MAEEEESQKCSNNSNSGNNNTVRSSKKQKQKKVPQRGLGVAQLERIRLEEQQKKDGFTSKSPPNKLLNSNPIIPNYPCDVSSPNSILRPDIVNSISVHQNVPKIWNSFEYDNLHLEKKSGGVGVDPGLAFRSGLNLPFEPNPIWPLPCLMQRAHYHHQNQHQHPLPPSSMVNISSSTSSSSSSSLQNLYVELPSNQTYYGNYTSLLPEEEKIVGMKRQYPFCVDNHHPAPFHCKFPPPIGRSDESISFNFREGPSCSDSVSDPKKSMKENGAFSAEFLTLAPPSTTTNSKLKLPNSAYLGLLNSQSFDFDSLPYQGSVEDRAFESGASELQHYYSFLPPAISQIGQSANKISNCNGSEVAENNIDLNLKL